MNDKQQLAAMGAKYRLTEEQAKGLAERMPKTGALQVIDDEPLCTEIRINGVEACGADIGGLLDRCLPHTTEQKSLCMAKRIEELESKYKAAMEVVRDLVELPYSTGGLMERLEVRERARDLLAGQVTAPAAPEGWQLVPVEPTESMIGHGCGASVMVVSEVARAYGAMLAAAPKPDTEHPDALVALSDIASLQRYTLGGHCDSFGQDCGAEMEPDDEGEYILLSEAMVLAAAPKPEAK